MTGYEAAIVDVDGTILRGDRLLEGATDGLAALEAAGISPLLFSNNPTRGGAHYRTRVETHGIEIGPENALTSATVTAEYLAANHHGDAVYLVGEDRLAAILRAAGLSLTDDPTAANLVVGSIDRSFGYDRLEDALVALERDVPFYGTDPDATIPTENGAVPGSGAILAAMEAIAGREPDAILGKPSSIAADAALERLGADPTDTIVVGDRLDTDVALGERAGMTTAVVLTGLTTRADLERSSIEPDHVLESLADLETVLDG
ncbi:HAD-IIA family hydrolase [Natrialbaceae archaeon AArc-T1-2]|uniref:HAD-IIA family hydrolase n=1 Tax=Natrialbaceae archaeon AArc-T1-2 TaxID=3053904 RepID=UPI00255AD289|nr:HAD-IIA family hydrolase [Natrialbaceae archaeon AArc-T1-2]WIV68088.1 HAD-IIA family hydrolase [Natrialbaceae archaeon AArc-T1-2]